jgi:hypothetical protein
MAGSFAIATWSWTRRVRSHSVVPAVAARAVIVAADRAAAPEAEAAGAAETVIVTNDGGPFRGPPFGYQNKLSCGDSGSSATYGTSPSCSVKRRKRSHVSSTFDW